MKTNNWDIGAIQEIGKWSEDYMGDLEKVATENGYSVFWNLKSRITTMTNQKTRTAGAQTQDKHTTKKPTQRPNQAVGQLT